MISKRLLFAIISFLMVASLMFFTMYFYLSPISNLDFIVWFLATFTLLEIILLTYFIIAS